MPILSIGISRIRDGDNHECPPLLRIVRKIFGIGFQPVKLRITGWKPMPRFHNRQLFHERSLRIPVGIVAERLSTE